MNRDEKVQTVQDLNGIFASAGVVVVTHYSGLTVADMTRLRSQMAEAGANFRVIKNRLAKIALDGAPCAGISDLFAGPIAIAFSEDPIAAPKAAALKDVMENKKVTAMAMICAICKAQFTKVLPHFDIGMDAVTGVHQFVSNAIVLTGEKRDDE